MILFQIFLLMLLASYLTGAILAFFLFFLGAKSENEKNPLGYGFRGCVLSWVAVAAFMICMAEATDEINSKN